MVVFGSVGWNLFVSVHNITDVVSVQNCKFGLIYFCHLFLPFSFNLTGGLVLLTVLALCYSVVKRKLFKLGYIINNRECKLVVNANCNQLRLLTVVLYQRLIICMCLCIMLVDENQHKELVMISPVPVHYSNSAAPSIYGCTSVVR